MEKETKILLGVGVLAAAYYFYKTTKESAVVSSIDTKTPLNMPTSSISTPVASITPIPVVTIPVGKLGRDTPYVSSTSPLGDMSGVYDGAGTGASIIADKKAAQQEADRLAEMLAYEEENARQEAMRLANIKAYQEQQAKLEKIDGEVLSAMKKEQARREAEDAAREKAMNEFMYPTCPEGFEFYQSNCMPTYIIVEEKAKKGEGLILRDYKNNTTTLVQSCPAEYVKQGINCIPRYSLSPQQLQVMAMEEAGMVQTSDGQWYTSAAEAAKAQALIDTYNSTRNSIPAYSERQKAINEALCSIDRNGYINNPYSSVTNGMSLTQYIGQFKVLAGEIGIARASCPNSLFSIGQIAGGRDDDNALGYKEYDEKAAIAAARAAYENATRYYEPNIKKTAVEPDTKPCEVIKWNCGDNPREIIQIPTYADCFDYQYEKPPCAPPRNEEEFRGFDPFAPTNF